MKKQFKRILVLTEPGLTPAEYRMLGAAKQYKYHEVRCLKCQHAREQVVVGARRCPVGRQLWEQIGL